MLFIICHLDCPTAGSFIDSALHGLGHGVRIHNHMSLTVAGCPTDGLDQATLVAEETFLVCIKNCHQTNLGNVDSLAQQVNPNQNVKDTQAQVSNNLGSLQGLDIRVHVLDLDTHFLEVVRQIFRHLLGQGCDKGPLILFDTGIDFT